MTAVFTAALAVGTYAYGTYKSIEENKKGRQATERAQAASEREYAAESKKAEIQNLRSVRQQIRQARVAQSTMQNVGAQTGGMGSSGMAGGVASVGSQLGSNLGYMSQIASVNTQIGAAAMDFSRSMGEASMASSRASEYAAVAGVGSTIFGAVGGVGNFRKG
jgi:Flp pilus assembly protein TadB